MNYSLVSKCLAYRHGRGGQSALRFARLRLEKRHNYVRKVAELAVQMFITADKPNVSGLVLAGSADFKSELQTSDMFDQRLASDVSVAINMAPSSTKIRRIVIKMVDVSYGGEIGFNQAIELSAETLGSVKLVQEKRLLQKFFDEISQDTGKYCFMVVDTLRALELGAVETLIVWENLDIDRIKLRNHAASEDRVLHLSKEQQAHEHYFHDSVSGVELEEIEKLPLVEWLANNYKSFGTTLEFITNRSQEGSQFCRGFGGIGGILRWRVDFLEIDMAEDTAGECT